MRKLYTDVSLEAPFMVSYNNAQTQACANDEDTVTIGATEFIRLTDENGHNVSDGEGNQLLLKDGVIYKVVSGVPESTNVQVTDVSPEPTPTQYTLTISPTPSDATVVLTATGFAQVGNSITVDAGTTVTYTVSKTGYVTVTDSIVVNSGRSRSVVLEEEPATGYSFTVNVTNAEIDNAKITISPIGGGFTPRTSSVGKTFTYDGLPDNQRIQYSVNVDGYYGVAEFTNVSASNTHVDVTLEAEEQPSETLWYLTGPTSQVIIDMTDTDSMTTSFALMPLWNDFAADGTLDPQSELKATSGTVGSEYRVWVSTSAMGVIEAQDSTTGETMYVTPLVAKDGDVYHKVAYNAFEASKGRALYMRLTNYAEESEHYGYNLYASYGVADYGEAVGEGGHPITVNVV